MKKSYLVFSIIFTFCILLLTYSVIFADSNTASGPVDKTNKNTETIKMEDIFDDYIFMGLVELYYGSNSICGNLELIKDTDEFPEMIHKGRMSFYLKGKIKGRYLLTVWLDTEEENLNEVFNNLDQRRFDTSFAGIEPDKYYPIYGDDSTVSSEIDTAGKLYLCLESEELRALWGNYKINYNLNQLIKFNRSFYGFNLDYESDLSFNTFWQQPISLHSQDEMIVTGCMLYYLRNDDVVIGSESLRIELRDITSGRVKKTITLVPDVDYEINYFLGRVILKKNINSLIGTVNRGLIEDGRGKDKYYLIVNYDYDYNYQNSNIGGPGLEMSYQLTDKLLLGGTYLNQQDEGGEAYRLSGVNLNYTLSDTSLKLDWARSENVLSGKYISDDGGLSYEKISLVANGAPSAWNLEYEQNLKNADSKGNNDFAVYYSKKDQGFSSGSHYIEENTTDYGISLSTKNIEEQKESSFSYDKNIKEDNNTGVFTVDLARQQTQNLGLEGQLQYKQFTELNTEYSLTGAFGFDYQLASNKKIYGSQQLTIDKSDGMSRNNLTKLGGELTQGKWNFNSGVTIGDKDSLNLGAGYRINETSEIYSSIEKNFNEEGKETTTTTLGSSSQLTDKSEIYGEYRIDENIDETERSNVLGLDYSPAADWLLSLDYSFSEVDKIEDDSINRRIIGLGSTFYGQDLDFAGRMEYRKDDNGKDLEQFILASDLNWRYNQDFTFLARIEFSREKEINEDEYIEGTIGLAYRPVELDRLNLIGKYTYLRKDNNLRDSENGDSDDSSADQESNSFIHPTERSQVFSIDVIYELNPRWQLVEKLAYKNGDVKLNSIEDSWTASETFLWINRLNYQLQEDIGVFAEYRILETSLAEDRNNGFLLGGYKQFPYNMRLGIGYNFTDFNDDLTALSYEADGWFINLIKAW
jgi:hypothetical protein